MLLAERDEYRDTLLRVKAEFENYRKRVAREETELRERAAAALAEKLLVVLDACDAAIGHGAIRRGTDREDAGRAARAARACCASPPRASRSIPTIHEAVMHEPGDEGEAVVVETLRTGYEWKGRVLRPAMVKVRG